MNLKEHLFAMKKISFLTFILLICNTLYSQVTVGDGKVPEDFSVLEISTTNTKGGLRLPRLTSYQRDSITTHATFTGTRAALGRGLTIYNLDTDCIEYWNETKWISLCDDCDNNCTTISSLGCYTLTNLKVTQGVEANLTGLNLPYWGKSAAVISLSDGQILNIGSSAVYGLYVRVDGAQTLTDVDGTIKIKITGTASITGTVTIPIILAGAACSINVTSESSTGTITTLDCDAIANVSVTEGISTNQTGLSLPYSGKSGANISLTDGQILNTGGAAVNGLYIRVDGAQTLVNASGNIRVKVTGTATVTGIIAIPVTLTNASCVIYVSSVAPTGVITTLDCGAVSNISVVTGIPANYTGLSLPYSGKSGSDINLADGQILNTSGSAVNGLLVQVDGAQILTNASGNIVIKISGTATTAGNISIPITLAGADCSINVTSGMTIPDDRGTGGFTGKLCFDIAFSNNNTSGCGTLSGRSPQRTNFEDRREQDPKGENANIRPYTGVQVYTFTPTGAVSNVRFAFKELGAAEGLVVEKIEPKADYSGNNITTPCKLVVYYKVSLNETLKGITRKNALKIELYAVYNNGATNNGKDIAVVLTPTFQDCACCGAMVSSTQWLNFMCHNLGANEDLDPFVWNNSKGANDGFDIKGDIYQWGRITDGHEKRNSALVKGNSTSFDDKGQVAESSKIGKWIYTNPVLGTDSDWRTPSDDNLWQDGAKGKGDPCPSGWKVPSKVQWEGVLNYNTWTFTELGYKVGDALYLPITGSRHGYNGEIAFGTEPYAYGYYWSSTPESQITGKYNNKFGYVLQMNKYYRLVTIGDPGNAYRKVGFSVRCVEE